MNLIEIYNNTDNTHRQQMFCDYLKEIGLSESSYKQYAFTHPKNDAITNIVYEVSKKANLFEVVDLLQVQSIYTKVNETEANKRVKNALSATISNYKKFLDYLETEDSVHKNIVNVGKELIFESSSVVDFMSSAVKFMIENDNGFELAREMLKFNKVTVGFDKCPFGKQVNVQDTITDPRRLDDCDKSIKLTLNGLDYYFLKEQSSTSLKIFADTFNEIYEGISSIDINENDYKLYKYLSSTKSTKKGIEKHNYWVYAPGASASKWQECQEENLMLLAWDEIEDFNTYKSRADIVEKLREINGNADNTYMNDSLAIWQFCHEMRPGDIVYVKKGLSLIVGRGVIKGNYQYKTERYEYKNSRPIEWTQAGEWEYPKKLPMKTLTCISSYKDMIDRIEDIINPTSTITQKSFDMSALINSIKQTGLLYDDNLLRRYACSLMTKPFVILSGLAGSGKTQLALAFAHAMSENVEQQLCVVPVGADWTNREPLLGYPNALKVGEYMPPESGVLQIMMRALRNPNKPYFLVLDEMNLSYVERYFADFLSALESNQEIPLWDAPEENDSEVPGKIVLPKNLFITGTINVDETTYMFSPKVLDRANVIEFKISEREMEQFLMQDMNVNVKAADRRCVDMGQDFVMKALQKNTERTELAEATLLDFFKELKKVNAEYGYRSATEIYRFIANAKAISDGMSDYEILDAAIVQKLLPKLHGSRKKLEPVLRALWQLCMQDEHTNEAIMRENLEYAKFPESADKILRMMQTALDNGFTSFAEA